MSRQLAGNLSDDAWQRFLNDAIPGLREAARRVNDPMMRHEFEQRPGWFGKPNRALGGVRLPDETAISRALVQVMEEMQAEQFLAAPYRKAGEPDLTRLDFGVEVDRKHDPAIGPQSQPTDIQIAIRRDRIDLRIEAKKLTHPSDIAAAYMGADGLGRFDDPNAPYTLERFGGMIAYVTDLDAQAWGDMIIEKLRTIIPSECLLSIDLTNEMLIGSMHVRDVDIELRKVKGRFRTDVFHMVLEFEAAPSRRAPATPEGT